MPVHIRILYAYVLRKILHAYVLKKTRKQLLIFVQILISVQILTQAYMHTSIYMCISSKNGVFRFLQTSSFLPPTINKD